MLNKVFIVTEHGGEWEDAWDRIIAVCATKELAEEIKVKSEYDHSGKGLLSEAEWEEIADAVYDCDDEGSFEDVAVKLFPQYSKELIEKCYLYYEFSDDYVFTSIDEYNVNYGNSNQ